MTFERVLATKLHQGSYSLHKLMATIQTQHILELWGDKIEIEEVMDMQTY